MNIFALLFALFGSVGGLAGGRSSGKAAVPQSEGKDTAGALARGPVETESESFTSQRPDEETAELTDPETEAGWEPEPEPETEPETETGWEPEPEPETEPETETGWEPEPEPETEPETETGWEPEPEPETEPETETGWEPEPEPETEPETETGWEPEPEPETEPEQPPIATDSSDATLPEPPTQSGGSGEDGGDVADTPLAGSVNVISGRVTTLAPQGSDIASIRILDGPAQGHVSVNPDNTLALVLTGSDHTGAESFRYEVTHSDGSVSAQTANLNVTAGPMSGGWGAGDTHYMLETNAQDEIVIEHGDDHRPVYVSDSSDALTLADIAALEGLDVSQITGKWLEANPAYGGSEGEALAQDAGAALWSTVSGRFTETSNWLLLERGYEYDQFGQLIDIGTGGESELHPLLIGAWGTGDKPEITTGGTINGITTENIVFQDVHFTGGMAILDKENLIFDNVTFTERALTIQSSAGITIRESEFHDIYLEAPKPGGTSDGGNTWEFGLNRMTGLFMGHNDGILIEGNSFNQIGWAPDYHYDLSTEGGQPPSYFNHAIYLNAYNSDVTMRDSIVMNGATTGIQFRMGGYMEDNVFIENNISVVLGYGAGEADGRFSGNYTLFTDNVVTSAANRTAAEGIGYLTHGVEEQSHLATLVDNIVAHLADPNNSGELAWKTATDPALTSVNATYYDDTIIANWEAATTRSWLDGWRDQNIDGLDPAVIDQTTIQLFTAQLLGKSDATIADLANYLRAQADGAFDDVVDGDLIVEFFQKGFGIAPDIRTDDGLIRFIPDDLGDGVRWDNRLNWSSEDLPGSVAGDSVDLGGNKVIYGGTTTIDELEFGPNGGLQLEHGKLTVDGGLETGRDPATLEVNGAGQIWTEGANGTGKLDIDVDGGRFANTGRFQANSELTATDGQTILAADTATYAVTDGSRLEVVGDDAQIGFDGENGGMAILGLGDDGTLAFTAKDGDLGTIEEFRSGAMGDAPDVHSGADLGGGALEIDITDLAGGSQFTLLDVDELIGIFDSTNVTGLSGQNAEIIVDYEADAVRLKLSAGSGAVNVTTIGAMNDVSAGEEALWNALTAGQGTYDDALPANDDEDFLFVA